MIGERNGSGGNGNGFDFTICNEVRSVFFPSNRSSITCAPKRDAPTPRPVYPIAYRVNQDRVAYTYGRDTLLMVVADGMGGHAGGEIAAQICGRSL